MNILIDQFPENLTPKDYVTLDLEIFEAEEKRLHRQTGRFACLSANVCGSDDVYVITTALLVQPLLDRLSDVCLTFQNAKFDVFHLRRWAKLPPRKKLWDTMIIEKLLWSGYYDRFALGDMTRRYLDVYLDKSVRDTFETATELSQEQIYYCAEDALRTSQVMLAQKQIVLSERPDAFKVYKEVDLPAMWAFLDFQGFRVDVDAWYNLAETNKAIAVEAESHLDFNPRSPKQIVDVLRSKGFHRIPNSQQKTIQQFMDKYPDTEAHEIAQHLLAYKDVYTLHSRYGRKFIEPYLEQEDDYYVVFPDHRVVGATTGRTAVSNPALHQVPVRDNPEFRKPWIAKSGNRLVVADWSSAEPRIQAFLSQDPNLIKIFQSGGDIYIETHKLMFDESIEKSDPKRNMAKTDFLAATYLQTPRGLAERNNISLDEAEDRHRRFFNAYPMIALWVEQQRHKKDYVETVMGRRLWLNPYSTQSERNAVNHPHQGTSADILKMTLANMHQDWNFDYPFGVVHQNHDEIICDVPEHLAKEVAEFMQYWMEKTADGMIPGIPNKAEAKIADSWLEAK